MSWGEVAAERRLGELLAVAAAVHPVLDDFTRARVAAKLGRHVDRRRAGGEPRPPRWIGWELGELGEVDELDARDERDVADELDEAIAAGDGVPDPSWHWQDDDPEPRRPLAAPRHPAPMKRGARASWTSRVLLASGVAALALGASLFDSLRGAGEGEPALLRDPIVASAERRQAIPFATPKTVPAPREPPPAPSSTSRPPSPSRPSRPSRPSTSCAEAVLGCDLPSREVADGNSADSARVRAPRSLPVRRPPRRRRR